ncbi:MAG: carbohydrate kinase family protein [Tropicimonas sp.]|uniref:carbohydrate kinase family protein n=1 Tax=Tropicimonas sp. TaxID=2067044 RepID=UPI003A8AE15C
MDRRRQGFITAGTWCLDYNLTIPYWPEEESATPILGIDKCGGGSGCNFAVDMRRLAPEIPVSTISLCGEDDDGRTLREVASTHGIDISRFHVDPALVTHSVMAFTARDSGKRTHVYQAASSAHLSPDHFDFAGCDAWMLHLGLPGTHALLDAPWQGEANGWVSVLKKARAAGLKTNMEVMSIPVEEMRALLLPCLPFLDFLVVNDYEAMGLAGRSGRLGTAPGLDETIAALRDLLQLGTMEVVAAHFPGGAVAVERSGAVHSHPSVRVPAESVVGTNGAGDAFAAGFFCGLHRGRALAECLAWGHAAAAASLRAVDTYSSVEPIEDCLALAAGHGWREPLEAAVQ